MLPPSCSSLWNFFLVALGGADTAEVGFGCCLMIIAMFIGMKDGLLQFEHKRRETHYKFVV
jgi:hypothetical protein